MDEKAREEIHNRMFFKHKSDYNRLEVDETIDLAEKATDEKWKKKLDKEWSNDHDKCECEYCKRTRDVEADRWKSAVGKALPCQLQRQTKRICNEMLPLIEDVGFIEYWCHECKARKEIFKEVGI
jgi:hypothetical protein